jgi:hypothetical protein
MPDPKRPLTSFKPMKVPANGVTIRMYDVGFGDCFLLAFLDSRRKKRYVLLDCGVHKQHTEGREKKIRPVAEDIAKVTNNHLDIVAISHEHEDHLLGFTYARDVFDKVTIDDLWLAWTENPDDPATGDLKKAIKTGVTELTSAMDSLKSFDEPLASTIQDLLGFELSFGAAEAETTDLKYLQEKRFKTNKKELTYRHPGEEPLTIPGVSGVKVYVLGPPKKDAEEYIKISNRKSEIYPEFAAISGFQPFVTALRHKLGHVAGEDSSNLRQNCPFDKCYDCLPKDEQTEPKYRSFFREFYGFTSDKGHGEEWRRIDSDWLATAGELALDLNKKTNNTSLVLAFELTKSQPHKVLLFPGDAEVGNWLSWYNEKR